MEGLSNWRVTMPGVSVTSGVLAVVSAFDERHRSLTLTDLAHRAGIPVPTAHRLVGGLVAGGALQRRQNGTYVIGRTLWRTAHTITRRQVLATQLGRIRRDGVATTSEEMSLGACSFAVPVTRSSDDFVAAAICVVVSSLKRDCQRLAGALEVAARGIGRQL